MVRKTVAFFALYVVLACSVVCAHAGTSNLSPGLNEHLQVPSKAASTQGGFEDLLHPSQWQWLKKFSFTQNTRKASWHARHGKRWQERSNLPGTWEQAVLP